MHRGDGPFTSKWSGNRVRSGIIIGALLVAALPISAAVTAGTPAAAAPTGTAITGEIERIFLDAPGDLYAGGQIVVGGHSVIVPRNLLLDLPANRITLQQLFAQAPSECIEHAETGLAKTDTCNKTGAGGVATLSAVRTNAGDVIAGDVFIQKGVELVSGAVTFINYAEGWLRLNGNPNSPDTGVMVRINDPTARHTVQTGLGCRTTSNNCSADPRFALDADNYTNVFTTGYPVCIPSTVPRSFQDTLDFDNNAGTTTLTAAAQADGSGDVLCPATNRPSVGLVVDDSRRFAPIKPGDWVRAEGNFETIDGVRFLSAHTTTVGQALQTKNAPGQPDYMFLDEVEIDAPGFQNQRARALFIGYGTQVNPDVMIWSLHRDPATNSTHEFPLATSRGCDLVGALCTGAGVGGPGIFKIRYDVDFIQQPTSAKLSPCIQLRTDARMGSGFCPDNQLSDEFAILSPVPHEIQARTGRKWADSTGSLRTIDISGRDATNGQYLFPLGINLGGIGIVEFVEFNLNALSTPTIFEGIPWLLDRRLSPGGCQAPAAPGAPVGCESSAQPLTPFPFSGLDPRSQAANTIFPGGAVPTGVFADGNFTTSPLSNVSNRILSYVSPSSGMFDGDNTLVPYPPNDPASQGVVPTPPLQASGPLLTGFTPAAGAAGTTVVVGGLGLQAATAVTFGGTPAVFSVLNAGRIIATVPAGAPAGPISVTLSTLPADTTLSTATAFATASGPSVVATGALSPTHGPVGTVVTIMGTSLQAVTGVSFGGVAATNLSIAGGGAAITAVVPLGAVNGPVILTSAHGTVDAGTFTMEASTLPTITGFNPTSGPPGTTVTITGTQLGEVTSASFNGLLATATHVVDAQHVTAVVPQGATNGPITLATPSGNTSSTTSFTVTAPPAPPVASAGAAQVVGQGSIVTLNASASTGFTTLRWTQTSGPAVVLSDPNAAKPTFTFPDAFANLVFLVTATNLGGSSTDTVTINAVPDVVRVLTAQFLTSTRRWTVTGTANIKAPDNQITVRAGSIGGPVIGSTFPDAAGNWTLDIRNSPIAADGTVVVTSVRGGSATSSATVR